MSFDYSSGQIEVFIVSNDKKEINGYAEVSAVAHLLSPYTRISSTQIWNTTHPSYKVQNNGKNFIHAIAICKYLSTIPESETASYESLRQLVRDLFVGDQKELDDETRRELEDIKDKLGEQTECINKLSTSFENVLGDFNSLLKIMKSELVDELRNGNAGLGDDPAEIVIVDEKRV
nr:p24 capsid [Darna trima granulovirus]